MQFKSERYRRRLAEAERASQQDGYLSGLSDQQLAVIHHPAKLKTIRAGRRGGKTHLIPRWHCKVAQDRPGARTLVLALTRPSSKRLVWNEFHKVNRDHGLDLRMNGQDLVITYQNGSETWLAGATRGPEIEKLRGHPFDLITTDESGSFGEELEYVMKEVLNASLEDYGGTVAMFGTPNAAAAGAFFDYDTSTAEHIAHFHWTVLDNPMFPRWAGKQNWRQLAKEWWQEKIKREGWADDDPVMHREWLAKWVRDSNRLVYRVVSDNRASPAVDEYSYILGADLGWNDAKTIVVLACSNTTNKLQYVDCFEQSQMLIDDYAQTLKAFIKKYKPVATVCDAGALGKDIVELLRQRHNIPIEAAEKKHKPANIAFLNSALQRKTLSFAPGAEAIYRQMSLLQWKDKFQLVTDQSFREDLCDAALYAFRYATNVYKPERVDEPPKPGTREFLDEQAKQMKARALRRVRQGRSEGSPDHEFAAIFERD